MEKKLQFLWLVLFALTCAGFYHVLAERKATVHLEVQCAAPALFKIYWLDQAGGSLWNENNCRQIRIWPDQNHYFFKLANLASIASLRIDPSEEEMTPVTIRAIILTQNGYAPIRMAGHDALSRLTPGQDIASVRLTDEGLTITPSGKDSQLFLDLASVRQKTALFWTGELAPLIGIFLLVLLAHLALRRCFDGSACIVLGLAVVLVLIASMATISDFGVHPDETMHVSAADYFQQHLLPPPVGAEGIRHTYSPYGVSRLHSGEVAYLFLGKFARALQALPMQSYQAQRCANVALWAVLLLLACAYADFRLLMLPLLLSPQIWYLFSYVNSEAFACLIMMLAAWQLAAPNSTWNRLLADNMAVDRPGWFASVWLGLLFGLLLLTKPNFSFFVLFAGCYVLWRLCFRLTPPSWRNARQIALVAAIGLGIFGVVRGVDAGINGFAKGEKLQQARCQYAAPLWNPGTPLDQQHPYLHMRDRGRSITELLTVERWGGKSFQSAFGCYGFSSVSAAPVYYQLVRLVGLLALGVATLAVLVHGGRAGMTLWLLTLTCAGGLIAVALYRAWTMDFQPQGRYFLPIVGMLAVCCLHARDSLFKSQFSLLCAALFLLSLYSFIGIGLAGISRALL